MPVIKKQVKPIDQQLEYESRRYFINHLGIFINHVGILSIMQAFHQLCRHFMNLAGILSITQVICESVRCFMNHIAILSVTYLIHLDFVWITLTCKACFHMWSMLTWEACFTCVLCKAVERCWCVNHVDMWSMLTCEACWYVKHVFCLRLWRDVDMWIMLICEACWHVKHVSHVFCEGYGEMWLLTSSFMMLVERLNINTGLNRDNVMTPNIDWKLAKPGTLG